MPAGLSLEDRSNPTKPEEVVVEGEMKEEKMLCEKRTLQKRIFIYDHYHPIIRLTSSTCRI